MDNTLIKSLLPIVLVLFKDDMMYYVILLIVFHVIDNYGLYILSWFKSSDKYELIISHSRIHNQSTNVDYIKHHAIMHMISDYQIKTPKLQDMFNSGNRITFGLNGCVTVLWNNNLIYCKSKSYEKYDEIKISAVSMDILSSFVIAAVKKYKYDWYLDQSGMSIYKWHIKNSSWISCSLNVNKTRENIYLEPINDTKIFGGVEKFLSV